MISQRAGPPGWRGLHAHGELWDPFTFRTLSSIGVGEGWRCLEIGAGTGSVGVWLHKRVGCRGQVVATDVDTRWPEPMASTNLVVRHHNVPTDTCDDGYDLTQACLVLEHLPQRHAVARKLAAALSPGGRLVIEDYDTWTVGGDAHGRELRTLLLDAGLTDVATERCVRRSALPAPSLVAAVGRAAHPGAELTGP